MTGVHKETEEEFRARVAKEAASEASGMSASEVGALMKGLSTGLSMGLARGLDDGRAEGRTEGKAAALELLLNEQFVDGVDLDGLSRDVEKRILMASETELDGWLRAVLTAECPDDVFRAAAPGDPREP